MGFLDPILKAQINKEKNPNKWYFIKIKNSCSDKDTIKQMKRQSTDRSTCKSHIQLIKNLYSEY